MRGGGDAGGAAARWASRQGRAFELNNRHVHSVESEWDENRVHLIFDILDEAVPCALHPEVVECATHDAFHDAMETTPQLRDFKTWPQPKQKS